MGMDYHIKCLVCEKQEKICEFSIVGFLSLKCPDDAPENLKRTVEFLLKHKRHKITVVDGFGKETRPDKIDGRYVLGLEGV